MTLREALKAGEAYLAQREIPDAAIDAWYLLEYVLKREAQIRADRAWYLLHSRETLEERLPDPPIPLCHRFRRPVRPGLRQIQTKVSLSAFSV